MNDSKSPARDEGAYRVAQDVSDEVVRNLILLGIASARMRFVRPKDMSVVEWSQRLPAAEFDMEFFARILAAMFERPEIIRAILDGKSLQEATGWDV